jgi:hypothetical protein
VETVLKIEPVEKKPQKALEFNHQESQGIGTRPTAGTLIASNASRDVLAGELLRVMTRPRSSGSAQSAIVV